MFKERWLINFAKVQLFYYHDNEVFRPENNLVKICVSLRLIEILKGYINHVYPTDMQDLLSHVMKQKVCFERAEKMADYSSRCNMA